MSTDFTDVTLYFSAGKSTAKNNQALLNELSINAAAITWSWYEPKPESLIGSQENSQTLMPILRKGPPQIPLSIKYSELMLFFKQGGIVITAESNGFRYFHFSELPINASGQGETGVLEPCSRQPSKVMLRNQGILKEQFNLQLPDGLKNDYPESLRLTQYHYENYCIAWTLTDINIKKNGENP